jgi:predicted TPR repeat methyltransferase
MPLKQQNKSYWETLFDEQVEAHPSAFLKQVLKTEYGSEIDTTQLDLVHQSIQANLALDANDSLLDLCCGNGLITSRLAANVQTVEAIDFSSCMIDIANSSFSLPNVNYRVADVSELSADDSEPFSKILMYEGIQYLDQKAFRNLLHTLTRSSTGFTFFIGGVPDRQRIRHFYKDEEQYQFYLDSEREGRPHLGHWWDEKALTGIARLCGCEIVILPQNPGLYTQHYRFDCLIKYQTSC